jgi:hypothetical protein
MTEPMAIRATAMRGRSWAPAPRTDADQEREEGLRSRIRRLLTSGSLHRRPWHLSTRLHFIGSVAPPCVICFEPADTICEEPASRFAAAAHAEPCWRLWIEEALGVHE